MTTDQRVVIATSNAHKFAEIVPLFAESSWQPILPQDMGIFVPEVAETGSTFAENAILKAKAYQLACSLPVIADDTGLEVLALNGQPGVHSNRWHPGSYTDRNEALLERLKTENNRSAQFTTVACLLVHSDSEPLLFRGCVTGQISTISRGVQGFGYDPLFVPDGYSQTFGELDPTEKQTVSHRARAFIQVIAALKTL